METTGKAAGWYQDPDWPKQMRYWDGQQWTDQRVMPQAPVSVGGIAAGVAGGILAVVVVLYVIWQAAGLAGL